MALIGFEEEDLIAVVEDLGLERTADVAVLWLELDVDALLLLVGWNHQLFAALLMTQYLSCPHPWGKFRGAPFPESSWRLHFYSFSLAIVVIGLGAHQLDEPFVDFLCFFFFIGNGIEKLGLTSLKLALSNLFHPHLGNQLFFSIETVLIAGFAGQGEVFLKVFFLEIVAFWGRVAR